MNKFLLKISKAAKSFTFKIRKCMGCYPYIPEEEPTPPVGYPTVIMTVTAQPDSLYIGFNITAVDGSFNLSWGDGETQIITSTSYNINHTYSTPGDYNISISDPLALLRFGTYASENFYVDTRNLVNCINLKYLSITPNDYGYFNTYDLRNMDIILFGLVVWKTNSSTIILKSEDIADWNPTYFRFECYDKDNQNHTIIFNSSDVSSWNPEHFVLVPDDTMEILGDFNSSDIDLWNPNTFRINSLAGEFNSVDISSWTNINYFHMNGMDETATGSFDLLDVPYSFLHYFELENKSPSYNITISPNSVRHWTKLDWFSILNNNLDTNQVDTILQEFYIGYVNKENSGGEIYISTLDSVVNKNSKPSGIYQASSAPTTGKEYMYELLNDSEGLNPGNQWDYIHAKPDALLYYTTTEPEQYVEISWISPVEGESLTIAWGDGSSDIITEFGSGLTHIYDEPYTYEIEISDLVNLKEFSPNSMWVFDSSYLDVCINLTDLNIIYGSEGIFNSYDLRNSPITYFEMGWMGENFTTIIKSEDMYNWNINSLRINELGTNVDSLIIMNSADISSWSPTIFQIEGFNMAAISGTFNSSDVSLWSPTRFMISNLSGEFNSSDIDSWTSIEEFRMYDMQSDATGSFNFNNVYPTIREFVLKNKPALYGILVNPIPLSGWSMALFFDLGNNNLNQTEVDDILEGFYVGYPSKYAGGGSILLLGNAEPSGVYQASATPTTGKEYAYELEFDSEGLNPGNTWSTVSIETS